MSKKITIIIEEIPDYGFSELPAYGSVPDCCAGCSNHPNNGGSGICHCTIPYNQPGSPGVPYWDVMPYTTCSTG